MVQPFYLAMPLSAIVGAVSTANLANCQTRASDFPPPDFRLPPMPERLDTATQNRDSYFAAAASCIVRRLPSLVRCLMAASSPAGRECSASDSCPAFVAWQRFVGVSEMLVETSGTEFVSAETTIAVKIIASSAIDSWHVARFIPKSIKRRFTAASAVKFFLC